MGQANCRMFAGASTTKIISTQNDIARFQFTGKTGIKTFEKVRYDCLRIRTLDLLSEIAGKHLVCI